MRPWAARQISQLLKFYLHLIDQLLLVLIKPNCLVSSQKNSLIVEVDLCKKTHPLEKQSTITAFRAAPVKNDSTRVTVLDEHDKGIWVLVEVAKICYLYRNVILIKFFPKGLI